MLDSFRVLKVAKLATYVLLDISRQLVEALSAPNAENQHVRRGKWCQVAQWLVGSQMT
jgi:hypothetical protein